MKPLLIFLLISCFTIAQESNYERIHLISVDNLDTIIQGEWYLTNTEISNGFSFDTSKLLVDKRIDHFVVGENQLTIYPDTTERFYVGSPASFNYTWSYDTLFESNYLDLFNSSKKKKEKIGSYEVLNITKDEFVLRSSNHLNQGLDRVFFTIKYTYKRKGVDELWSRLEGKWYHCASSWVHIGLASRDTSRLTFTRASQTDCSQDSTHTDIEFYRSTSEQMCSISQHTKYDGVFYSSRIELSPNNAHIYFDGREYEILLLSEDELVIVLTK